MKLALIHSVRAGGSHCYAWTWAAEDGAEQSRRAFAYFFDCCNDARRKGYDCRFAGTKPGIVREPISAVKAACELRQGSHAT